MHTQSTLKVGCASDATIVVATLLCMQPMVVGSHLLDTTEARDTTSLLMRVSAPGNASVLENVPLSMNLAYVPKPR
jgi:hypothetical protein